jgi:hypothetical protein
VSSLKSSSSKIMIMRTLFSNFYSRLMKLEWKNSRIKFLKV